MSRRSYPTPHPDVNSLIDALKSEGQAVLLDGFVGMYLHGSLALGDFHPARSDIDFVIVTDEDLPVELIEELGRIHSRIAASDLRWRTNFEGSYIPKRAIRRYNSADCTHPVIRVDGSFGIDRHGNDWIIQRYVIREHGIIVCGPNPQTLIDPVSENDLRQAAVRVLHEWWAPQLDGPFRLQDGEYQAYAVLTMCRILYTAQYGTVVSKPVAARWVLRALANDKRWTHLIERALAWKHGESMDSLADTLDFMRYTLAHCSQM